MKTLRCGTYFTLNLEKKNHLLNEARKRCETDLLAQMIKHTHKGETLYYLLYKEATERRAFVCLF